MLNNLLEFLAHWGISALSLWLVSFMFRGIVFSNKQALFVAALLLGFANAIVRPIFILLTLPLTVITFGLFLLVINALMLMLVAALVDGFKISGFWTAFFASIMVAIFSFLIDLFIFQSGETMTLMPMQHGMMV